MYENDALCVVTAPGHHTTKTSAGNEAQSPVDELRQQFVALSERVEELHELRRGEGYGARMEEINAIRVEMARVASKLQNYHSSLPENSPNRGQGQTLDALCVENVLIPSYLLQESRDRSKRYANPSYMLPRTPGRRNTTSSTPLPAVDVPNRVHNTLDGFHKPIHQNLTCFDEIDVDCIETTKDTSLRRVPPFLPSVDVSKHVYNALDSFHKPTHRNSTCLDEKDINYYENTTATSARRVATFQPSLDASNRVHSLLNTSHNTKCRRSTCFDEKDVNHIENTEDMSVRRVLPSIHHIHTAGHRITMPTAHVLAVDVSKHVHNLPNMPRELHG